METGSDAEIDDGTETDAGMETGPDAEIDTDGSEEQNTDV